MHASTTKLGKRIYARYAGESHSDPICLKNETKSIHYSFDSLTPEAFITSLCYKPTRKKNTGKPGPSGGIGGNDPVPSDEEDDIKLRPFSSLKQIAEAGIDHLKAEDKQGAFKVSDFIMTYKFAFSLFSDPAFTLGSRIVYAAFCYFDNNGRSVRQRIMIWTAWIMIFG